MQDIDDLLFYKLNRKLSNEACCVIVSFIRLAKWIGQPINSEDPGWSFVGAFTMLWHTVVFFARHFFF